MSGPCPPPAFVRRFGAFHEGRISGSSSEDEAEIRAGEATGGRACEGHPARNVAARAASQMMRVNLFWPSTG
jgi:hypothetical protein